jgi:hypothetical protein
MVLPYPSGHRREANRSRCSGLVGSNWRWQRLQQGGCAILYMNVQNIRFDPGGLTEKALGVTMAVCDTRRSSPRRAIEPNRTSVSMQCKRLVRALQT